MPAGRNLLSAPTYGSMTGRINWNRGMDERLANPMTALSTPPVRPASAPTAAAPGYQKGAYIQSRLAQWRKTTQQESDTLF